MKLLAIDTSATAASVCLAEENKIIGEFFNHTAITHSQTLMPMLDALLRQTGTSPDELSAIAVNAGPGSFTGVRIGVAAVKGLAFAHGIPCVSVSTLESMAYNMLGSDCIVSAVMDARCSQVYNALFRVSGNTVERLCADRALALSDLQAVLRDMDKPVVLVGDGAEISYRFLAESLPQVTAAPINRRLQTASSTALAAFQKLSSCETMTAAELMPVYLRLPQAQRELNQRLAKQSKE
ncbi:MAG: tRNA (adenosine(37)-N6)-threonylcarbamoyltransferase complex dimerization subunit type 1 TsaB [Ruminococcus sp.]|nr:tRNA (adenosine(37)-N6)-threonylcarbamoyltransferase complex dimerization subunit type 1 TsaB [Ruminococcus sp.]